MLGINPVKLAKNELKKVDLNRNGVPDLFETLDAAEAGLEWLADFIDDIDEQEAIGILSALNGFRSPDKRRSDAEIAEAAKALVKVPAALRGARKALDGIEADLKGA